MLGLGNAEQALKNPHHRDAQLRHNRNTTRPRRYTLLHLGLMRVWPYLAVRITFCYVFDRSRIHTGATVSDMTVFDVSDVELCNFRH